MAVLLVVWLGHAAVAGVTREFDAGILLAMRQPGDPMVPRGPQWLHTAMRDITALGDTTVLTLVTVIAAALALVRRRVGMAGFIAVTIGFGAFIDTRLKLAFARPRPMIVPHLVEVTSASFPSGHAMNSAVACLTLAAVLAARTADRGTRAYIVLVGFVLTFVIGASRVYLGVHYPTDVIGGWLAGAAWVTACWLVAARRLGLAGTGAGRAGALPLAAHPAKARTP
jgi:undecaprenyl-diphosphatase